MTISEARRIWFLFAVLVEIETRHIFQLRLSGSFQIARQQIAKVFVVQLRREANENNLSQLNASDDEDRPHQLFNRCAHSRALSLSLSASRLRNRARPTNQKAPNTYSGSTLLISQHE